MSLRVDDLSFRYPGTEVDALSELSFEVPDGQALVVHGPFGAGKSTLLRILAGLEAPGSGTIAFDEGPVDAEFLRRNVSMVFQNYALMPNLSIEQNIALHRAGEPKDVVAADVRYVASILGLAGSLGDKARELAPSQRMRVAFARALVRRPRLLLLDEPLAHLDNTFSVDLRADLAEAIAATGVTTVLATDDAHEATSLGGQVVVLGRGHVREAGNPGSDEDPAARDSVTGPSSAERSSTAAAPAAGASSGAGDPITSAPMPSAPMSGADAASASSPQRQGSDPAEPASHSSDERTVGRRVASLPMAAPLPTRGDRGDDAYVNRLPAEVDSDGALRVGGFRVGVRVDPSAITGRVQVTVRSVDFDLTTLDAGLRVDVSDLGFTAGWTTVFGRCRISEARRPVRLEIKLQGDLRRLITSTIAVEPRPGAIRVVDRDTHRLIPSTTIES